MRIPEFDKNSRYTYANYLTWEGPERCELINGKTYMMASPSVAHQAIVMGLSSQFGTWLQGKPCRVFAAPLDVRLFPKEDNSDNTIVQPDLLVVCDKDKLGTGSVNGAPDLVIEFVSPSNSDKYMLMKYTYCLEAGVREYWMIIPEEKRVLVHVNEKDHSLANVYKGNDSIPVAVLPGLEIALESLWARANF